MYNNIDEINEQREKEEEEKKKKCLRITCEGEEMLFEVLYGTWFSSPSLPPRFQALTPSGSREKRI